MPLPVLIQHLARHRIGAYCERRIPAELRDTVRLDLRFEGDCVILFESRPVQQAANWASLDVARFRYNRASSTWMLDAPDYRGNGAWRPYSQKPQLDLQRLLALLDEDTEGVFWS